MKYAAGLRRITRRIVRSSPASVRTLAAFMPTRPRKSRRAPKTAGGKQKMQKTEPYSLAPPLNKPEPLKQIVGSKNLLGAKVDLACHQSRMVNRPFALAPSA